MKDLRWMRVALPGVLAGAVVGWEAVVLGGAGVVLAAVAVTGFLLAEMAGGRSR